jgi:predicted nucleic acid-binding protein
VDSSALLAYFIGEPNAVDLERNKAKCRLPIMALFEVHSVLMRRQDRALADRYFGIVGSWGVPVLHTTDEIVLAASRLRSQYRLGTGDAFIAAASACERLPLLTNDSNVLSLSAEIRIIGLR